jgi:hypothetical protein
VDLADIKKWKKEIIAWEEDDLQVQFILDLTISNSERNHTQGATTAAEAWFQLRQAKKPVRLTAVVDAIWQLYNTCCQEGQSIDAHIATLQTRLAQVTALGEIVPDQMFAVILTKSLPSSWQSWVAPFWGSKHLQQFGSNIFILDDGDPAKTEPKANKMVFVSFEDGSKSTHYYDLKTQKVQISCNFTFPKPASPSAPETASIPAPPTPTLPS